MKKLIDFFITVSRTCTTLSNEMEIDERLLRRVLQEIGVRICLAPGKGAPIAAAGFRLRSRTAKSKLHEYAYAILRSRSNLLILETRTDQIHSILPGHFRTVVLFIFRTASSTHVGRSRINAIGGQGPRGLGNCILHR